MLRAAIVERDKNRRELIHAQLTDMIPDAQIVTFANAYDLLEQAGNDCSAIDLLLISTTLMEPGDGISFAEDIRALNRQLILCFLSDSKEFYGAAFRVFAAGYLLYPVDYRELQSCVRFYFPQMEPERRASIMLKETGGNYRRIYARDIQYVESANREIRIHLEDGTIVSGYMKLDEAMDTLPADQFFRCHQSYLVNFYFTHSLTADGFRMDNIMIPVSRKFRKEAKEAFYSYTFAHM